jgi:dTDP-4-dehydrorhamnose reductase
LENPKMRILITGGSGKLGTELKKIFPEALAPSHNQLDLRIGNSVCEYVSNSKPDLLIHAGALTGIRECEKDKELAFGTNVMGTENLVRACMKSTPKCRFVYVSTACVFYGDKGNYSEKDIPYPKNYYALTKLLGEFVLRESPLEKLIIRTNFVERAKWPYERAFTDRYGTYLFSDDLARAINDVVRMNLYGLVHVCGKERISMFELARLTTPEVKPMTIAEYNGPPLTMDMSLRSIRIKPYEITKTQSVLTGNEQN